MYDDDTGESTEEQSDLEVYMGREVGDSGALFGTAIVDMPYEDVTSRVRMLWCGGNGSEAGCAM